MNERTGLADSHCRPLPKGSAAMAAEEISALLPEIPGWSCEGGAIRKTYAFASYGETVAFVNAVAWIARREDHHPDIAFGYNRCEVAFNTHSIGGISMNDFICAAKVEALL